MIEITERAINVSKVLQSILAKEAGALAHFIGTIRKEEEISGLFYECYPGMAQKTLEKISTEAKKKWPLFKISIVHRYGWVGLGEPSVVIAVSSAHRKEAFEACQFIIDQIKERVPIWKRGLPAREERFAYAENQ
ncbi:MAG: molybdenum cofactor biosynthesis protein MoaE [Deltaproteobacteria bacterium]|nr:molybdenum cofactor biosynthesis protein MoaE [Deltaproteobacteria bacterium]